MRHHLSGVQKTHLPVDRLDHQLVSRAFTVLLFLDPCQLLFMDRCLHLGLRHCRLHHLAGHCRETPPRAILKKQCKITRIMASSIACDFVSPKYQFPLLQVYSHQTCKRGNWAFLILNSKFCLAVFGLSSQEWCRLDLQPKCLVRKELPQKST